MNRVIKIMSQTTRAWKSAVNGIIRELKRAPTLHLLFYILKMVVRNINL